MGSLFEIHRSNLEWLKSYVYPDGFKLDSDRYQIGVSFELCHEHFDTFRAYAHANYFRKPVYRRCAHV